jgi:hypothetical protein
MTAQNTTISVAAGTWTQLTDANVTSITFQNKSGYPVFVHGTTDTTAPTSLAGAIRYNPGQGERNVALADLFPGIAAVRVWAFSESGVQVFASHA